MTYKEKLAAVAVGLGSLAVLLFAGSSSAQAGTAPAPTSTPTAATITLVQRALQVLSYWSGPIDGRWSADLEATLRRFQVAEQIPVTGQPDEMTMIFLARVADASRIGLSTRAAAYAALSEHGYTQSNPLDATRAFQRDYSLIPTGWVDTTVLDQLRDLGWMNA